MRDIMTPRRSFMNALRQETVRQAFTGVPDFYDALPVIDGNDRDSAEALFVGIINRYRANMASRVQEEMDMEAIEPILANMPMVDFISTMPKQRLLLVADPTTSAVEGLVTVHDLARLPARLAIFELLLDLEETIGNVIQRFGGDEANWKQFVTGKMSDELSRARTWAYDQDGSGSVVLEMAFSLKLGLLRGMGEARQITGPKLEVPDGLTRLRNTIAHGKPFAHRGRSRRHILLISDVPQVVAGIMSFRRALADRLQEK